ACDLGHAVAAVAVAPVRFASVLLGPCGQLVVVTGALLLGELIEALARFGLARDARDDLWRPRVDLARVRDHRFALAAGLGGSVAAIDRAAQDHADVGAGRSERPLDVMADHRPRLRLAAASDDDQREREALHAAIVTRRSPKLTA